MNCQLCQKELDAYRDGKLPRDMMTQVESHLKACEACAGDVTSCRYLQTK